MTATAEPTGGVHGEPIDARKYVETKKIEDPGYSVLGREHGLGEDLLQEAYRVLEQQLRNHAEDHGLTVISMDLTMTIGVSMIATKDAP